MIVPSQRPLFARCCARQARVAVHADASKSTRNAANAFTSYLSALVSGANAPKVALSQGSMGMGLGAAAPIAAKEAVLMIPEANCLTVPEQQGSSVFAWEGRWLAPFEAAHGPLPPALAYFISDREAPALARLSALILYVRKYAQTDLWKAWLALLPSLQSATFPGGPWTAAELEQLQLEPLKMLVAENHAHHASEAQRLFNFLSQDPDGLGLNKLQLADSVQDCLWAQFIAATRGSDAGTDDSSLHPLHDLLNHSDAPNCAAGVSTEQDGFFVQAAADIEPGEELTLCYAKPNRLSSAEMLLSWGFYPPTRPTDWAFNQHVHALPALPYDAVVAAAVRVLQATTSSSSSSSSDGNKAPDADVRGRLLAVVGSLPLQLPPELLLLQAAGSAAAATAAAETSYVPYSHAAAVALKYGVREDALEPLVGAAAAAAAAGDAEVSPIAAERVKAPSSQQRELAQAAFMQDVLELLASGHSSSSSGSSSNSKIMPQQHLQQCCAQALAFECTIRQLSCDSTSQQDEQMLQQLQQLVTAAPGSSKVRAGKGKGTAKGFGVRRVGAATAVKSSSSSSAETQTVTVGLESNGMLLPSSGQQQQQLSMLYDLQQQVLKQLLVLQATSVLKRNSDNSSSSNGSAADTQAAQNVLAVLQQQQQQHPADIDALQQRQAAVLQHLQAQQQQRRQQAVDVHALLALERVEPARLMAAVAARSERKRMLQLCADLCQQLVPGLQ